MGASLVVVVVVVVVGLMAVREGRMVKQRVRVVRDVARSKERGPVRSGG